jgi:hypothetical protein
MRVEPEWTDGFMKLQKKLKESQFGTWVFVDKKTENKYSNLNIDFVYRTRASVDNYFEYKAESNKEYILIRTFLNFISISRKEREHKLDHNIEVVAALNEERELNIEEIMYYMNWSKNKEYEYWEFQ